MNIVPAFVRKKIEHRPNLLKIVDNIGWLFFDKILRMGVGLFVGVWVARYLGPDQFGLFNFATAFVGMFGAVAGLGLQDIVVRDIVHDPRRKEETLGSAAVLLIMGGLLAYGLLMATIFWLRPDDTLAKVLVAILGSMLLFKPSEAVVCWFESQVQSKYIVWVQNSTFLVFAAIKVALILNRASLVSFAWATTAEASLVAVLLVALFGRRGSRLQKLRITLARVKTLFRDSWPLLLSGISIMIYMKIDQIMLGQMVNDEAVGIYSAAVRVSEVWYFVIGIVMASVFPHLAKLHRDKSLQLSRRWVQAYRIMFFLSITVSLFLTLLSGPIVKILFGEAYSEAAGVLAVHVWAGINVAIGSVWSKWLLLENKLRISLYGHFIGAIANILLNFLLIPEYGAIGAAIATLVSYFLSSILEKCLYKPLVTFGYLFRAITFREV